MRNTYLTLILSLLAGCATPYNPDPPASEGETLIDALQLTRGFEKAGEAYFSPDMQWIIFQAITRPDELYQMYVAQLKWENGAIKGINTPIRISPEGSWNTCGFFSPDGNSIIFASTGDRTLPKEEPTGYQREKGSYRWPTYPSEIFRADGWKSAIAALPPGQNTNLAKYALTKNDDYDAECAFSPDGKWIVFSSKADGDQELYAMKADGSAKVRLTQSPGNDGGPFFSPDGSKLVYRSDRKNNNLLQVFVSDIVYDPAGNITGLKNEKALTSDVHINWGPFWHPDGKHLAFSTSVHGHSNYEIYLMRTDGTRRTRLTFTPTSDVLPAFSPDGKWMMWTSSRGPGKSSQIWVARFKMPRGA